jgi:CheY-like chemotaxis protein
MLERAPINLSRLTADLLPMLRRVIGAHIDIEATTDLSGAAVLGDRSQLEQVILNLALNARDAMPAGGRLTIRTATVSLDEAAADGDIAPGPHAMLEVKDSGVGMDAVTLAKIFEPFFTTKEFGRGTGLGLATVYGIVKQMGGTVRVFSELQHGTTFRLYFPETRGAEALVHPFIAPEAPRGSETLLLVEDEPSVRVFATQVLRRQGYRVMAAEHPAAALALVRSCADPIHLVITDVIMPGGTGPELVGALSLLRPGLPALYISGYADGVLSREGAAPTPGHFLQKPFSANDLLTRVRQILTHRDSGAHAV